MSNYRRRPKGNYIQDASWKDLYNLAESWKNDIEFHLFEVDFFECLIETHFIKLLLLQNLDELRELQRDLFETRKRCKHIIQHIKTHLDHIVDIMDEPFCYNVVDFRADNEQLEDEASEFIASLKTVRYTVFKMTKSVLESEKPKFIWKYN